MSFRKRFTSFRHAVRGLGDLFKSQPNARIHLVATGAVVAAGIFFNISRTEWMALTLCVLTVIGLEAMNTAIEHLTDLASPDFHPLAGKTKDVAAAAVLVSALGSVVVAALIFLPKMVACFAV